MSNTEFEPIKSVDILKTKTDTASRSVGASIKDDGALLIDGLDWGKLPHETFGRDYEYSITIEEHFKDSVLLLLLKDKFPDFPEAEAWMKEHNVPFTRWTWS